MYCKHCGKQIDNDSNFCYLCGGQIKPVHELAATKPVDKNQTVSSDFERPQYYHFRKLTYPIVPTPSGRLEVWIKKKIHSFDTAIIEAHEKDGWTKYSPADKNCHCKSCHELFGFDEVGYLQDKWWTNNFKEGHTSSAFNYYCHQCMVSLRMTNIHI